MRLALCAAFFLLNILLRQKHNTLNQKYNTLNQRHSMADLASRCSCRVP